jgi:hypothetical protein
MAVELPGVDLLGDRLDDFGAAARPVACDPVRVVGPEPVQDAGPVQEIVHERVDRDHAAADFEPAARAAWRAEEHEFHDPAIHGGGHGVAGPRQGGGV